MFCTVFIVYVEDYATTNVAPEKKIGQKTEHLSNVKTLFVKIVFIYLSIWAWTHFDFFLEKINPKIGF